MTYQVEYTQEVYDDLKEITKWYSLQRENLDSEFLLSLEAVMLQLRRNPYQYEEKIRSNRMALLQRFPYRVIYKIYDTKILALGIFHTSRNPKLLTKRVK